MLNFIEREMESEEQAKALQRFFVCKDCWRTGRKISIHCKDAEDFVTTLREITAFTCGWDAFQTSLKFGFVTVNGESACPAWFNRMSQRVIPV